MVAESVASQGLVHKNDIALPLATLEHFLIEMEALFQARHSQFDLYIFGHIGDGNLHINWMKPKDLSKEAFLSDCKAADQSLFELRRTRDWTPQKRRTTVLSYGG
jgi:FAD/FMN-containing dehydrogenase